MEMEEVMNQFSSLPVIEDAKDVLLVEYTPDFGHDYFVPDFEKTTNIPKPTGKSSNSLLLLFKEDFTN